MDIDQALQLNILELFGLADASKEEQDALLRDLMHLVYEGVATRIGETLSVDDRAEFFRVFANEERSASERVSFLAAHVPDIDAIILEEVVGLKCALTQMADDATKETGDASDHMGSRAVAGEM